MSPKLYAMSIYPFYRTFEVVTAILQSISEWQCDKLIGPGKMLIFPLSLVAMETSVEKAKKAQWDERALTTCGDWGPTLGPRACTAAAVDKNSHAVSRWIVCPAAKQCKQ